MTLTPYEMMRFTIAFPILLAYILPAWAQEDLGFEALQRDASGAWRLSGEHVSADRSTFTEGETSLRLTSTGMPARAGAVTAIATQSIVRSQFPADRLRLSGDIKTERVEGFAGIWLRIEGPEGLIHIDDMRDRSLSGTRDWRRFEIDLPIPAETTRAMFGAHVSGRGTAWFDDLSLESYSSQSLPPPSEAVAAYLAEVLDIMEEHSIMAESIAWGEFRESAMRSARGLEAVDEAHTLVTMLVRRLGDNHSGFIGPDMASRLQSDGTPSPDLGDWTPPRSELLAGKFGYVMVPGYAGSHEARETRFADAIQQAIRDVDSRACGWLVDLRQNGGGNMWPMLAGLGPIIGTGQLGFLRRNKGARSAWWYRSGASGLGDEVNATTTEIYEPTGPERPTAVLISPLTASSGEAVALSFVGRDDTRTFGMSTAGRTTGNEPFTLADGAMLNLATSVMTDRNGREYPQGIEPDVVVEGQAAPSLASEPAVQAAMRWMSRLEVCR